MIMNDRINISDGSAKHFLARASNISEKAASLIEEKFRQFLSKSKEREIFRRKYGFAPLNITISPTYWCNLSCSDCYSNSLKENSGVLSHDITDRIIKEASEKWAVPFFTLTGGEPLLYAIESAKRHKDALFQVYTNGTLINREVADNLSDLGNIFPLISIEGFKDETNGIRGEGAYDRTMKAMELLTKTKVLWGISFTLTSQNANVYDTDDFLSMVIGKGALLGRFLTYMPVGRNADFRKVPSTEQRKRQGDALRKFNRDFYTIDYLNNPDLVEGCAAAGLRYVHVDPSGAVHPCVFIPVPAQFNLVGAYEGAYENLQINCLEDILVKDPLLQMTRNIAKKRPKDSCCLVIDGPDEFKTLKECDFSLNV